MSPKHLGHLPHRREPRLVPSCHFHGATLGRHPQILRTNRKSRITFLKEVPAGTGLSYRHTFHTRRPSLVATIPAGYADGLDLGLSNRLEVLVRGRRCPQVGRVTMDMSLIDVTALRGEVALGDAVVLIGRQEGEAVTADELAARLGTITYEVVTRIGARVPRMAVGGPTAPAPAAR